jgi:ATP-dependent dihydroxyacetone kinase
VIAFFNEPDDVVSEMLEGLCRLEPVRLLEDDRGLRVVVRRDVAQGRVAILSGGGAGHEPAHAGYVGEGMLNAAVSGGIFASPSVEAVLTGIRHVATAAGCLVIVKNYTGDRLNFGLAAERARSEGLAVATVRVADDVALPDALQPRGLAGTVLVHKLAGYLAARGDELEPIRARAQALADSMSTLGLALGPCQVPGRPAEVRSPELGMGIHNEPGARSAAPTNAREAMALVIEPLLAHVDARYGKDAPLVAMLGDLGGCSSQELLILVNELCRAVGPSRIARLVRPARVMTSLDMRGFSVTLAPADASLIAALDAPTSASAWPGVVALHVPERVHVAPDVTGARVARSRDAAVESAIERACRALVAAQSDLDAQDAKVGDGDAGSTFAAGARAVLEDLAAGHLATAEPPLLFSDLGALLSRVMGGSSGVLLSILFTAMGSAMAHGASMTEALAFGLSRVEHYGGAKAGDRTMLDALRPAAALLPEGVAAAAAAARTGADATAKMVRAGAGRSSYVPESALAGTIDPGAEAVARALAALAG